MRVWKRKMAGFVVSLGMFLLISSPLYGADHTKIGYVISPKILTETVAGKDFISLVENLQERKKQEIKHEIEALSELESEIRNKKMFLNADAKEELLEEIMEKEKKIKRMREDSIAEIKKAEKNGMRKINKEATEIISKIGEAEKYDLIIDINSRANNTIYINPELDITDQVIEMYDQEYNSKKKK